MRTTRRKSDRYGLMLPVVFEWVEGQATRREGGHTRNIGIGGAFILAGASPKVGTSVQFEFLLPSLLASNTQLKLLGQGRVVRVEPIGMEGIAAGFALANTSFSLAG